MSIWRRDADEIFERIAHAYLRFLSRHRWLIRIMPALLVAEFTLIWLFEGVGGLKVSAIAVAMASLFGVLVALRARRKRR